ncbi:hypothetical protein KHX94_12595 [Shewanella dokdonensis]|uniref:Uncharacterized protein n=1 Tax=Shewanella dokdonensis TaxID=712036 RepID=A0ABX8DEM5_9GAMM|nr:hypothetical protein [Shewanella dokdonensis]QVK22252.1 hypothetical protein KHX94_12595 [Shewanella dokdonensis]
MIRHWVEQLKEFSDSSAQLPGILWLLAYGMLAAALGILFQQSLFLVHLDAAGALVLALKCVKPKPVGADFWLIIGILLLSIIANIIFYREPLPQAALISATVVMQGLLGAWLLSWFGHQQQELNSFEGMIKLLFIGAILPALSVVISPHYCLITVSRNMYCAGRGGSVTSGCRHYYSLPCLFMAWYYRVTVLPNRMHRYRPCYIGLWR